jgi:hypothetical protein
MDRPNEDPVPPGAASHGRVVASVLCGAAALFTVAAAPFLIVPWLPRRLFGALPWLPTSASRVRRALDALPLEHTKAGQRFVDLGSGDGVAVIAAAERGMVAHGVELNPTLVILSRWLAFRKGVSKHATFEVGNLFGFSVSEADIVMIFGVVPLMQRIGDKLEKECWKPTYILSNKFALPTEWDPMYVQSVDGVRIYFKPARASLQGPEMRSQTTASIKMQ